MEIQWYAFTTQHSIINNSNAVTFYQAFKRVYFKGVTQASLVVKPATYAEPLLVKAGGH